MGLDDSVENNQINTNRIVHMVLAAVIGIFGLIIFFGSYYIIEPNEVAMIRRFGTVGSDIIKPGLHFKIPLIDTVDRLQVSIQQFVFDKTTFFSSDNQTVDIGLSITYKIPESAVYKLLYGMGRSGSIDIASNLRPIISQRLRQVVGLQNIQSFNKGMDEFIKGVTAAIKNGTVEWIEIVDVQISFFDLSPAFKRSNEAAMNAKNDALAAQYQLDKVIALANQTKAKATGDAEATLAKARADSDSRLLNARAEAESIRMKGMAEAEALNAKSKVLVANPQVTAQTWAERWNGTVPSFVMGESKGILPIIPMDALTKKTPQ